MKTSLDQMELLAVLLQLFCATPEAPEERDESDLHQPDDGEQEEDGGVHALRNRVRTAETDRAGGRKFGRQGEREQK